jgi:succinyl-CoA synthetase alpha subunit
MGHAGAIISGGKGTAAEKMVAMKKAGIHVVEYPSEIGTTMLKALQRKNKKGTRNSKPTAIKKAAAKKKSSKKTIKKSVKSKKKR